MRFLFAVIAAIFLTPAVAFGQSGDNQVGFVDLDINALPFPTVIRSTEAGTEQGTNTIEIFFAVMGVDGEADYPTLHFRLPLENGQPGPYTLFTYTELDPAAQRHEVAVAGAPFGARRITDFSITETDWVSFDYTGQLVFVDADWAPLPSGEVVEISGSVMLVIPGAGAFAR